MTSSCKGYLASHTYMCTYMHTYTDADATTPTDEQNLSLSLEDEKELQGLATNKRNQSFRGVTWDKMKKVCIYTHKNTFLYIVV
jgi:hypothetical protein